MATDGNVGVTDTSVWNTTVHDGGSTGTSFVAGGGWANDRVRHRQR